MKTSRFLLVAWGIGLGVAGCATRPVKEVHLVEVASSKPYRFLSWHPSDSDITKKEIRQHNRAHKAVLEAEKAAKP